jgi:hypothetical protein
MLWTPKLSHDSYDLWPSTLKASCHLQAPIDIFVLVGVSTLVLHGLFFIHEEYIEIDGTQSKREHLQTQIRVGIHGSTPAYRQAVIDEYARVDVAIEEKRTELLIVCTHHRVRHA